MGAVLLFDLVILGLLVVFAAWGAYRGLVLSLCSLLAVAVAFVGAGFAARSLSPAVARMLEPKFEAIIEERLEEAIRHTEFVSPESPGGVASTPAEVPLAGVLEILREMGLYENLIDTINDEVQKGMAHAAASAAAKVAAALAQSAAYLILFLLAFVLILAVWRLISKALDLVARLPGLHFLNKTLGAVFGLLRCAAFLFAAAWLIQFFGNLIPEETVQQTCLLRFFMTTNPLSLLGGF